MITFQDSGLKPEILKGIEKLGFKEPTPVQSKVIPLLLKGQRDLVALAQTGTGKTAAFGLPLLHMVDTGKRAVQALVLCPTRELCLQITKDLAQFGHFMPHVKALAVYGGSSIYLQMRALEQGVHILVATPGRMGDLLRRGCAKLNKVERVVLDEADEMLSMGFQEELEAILKDVPGTAGKMLFSATMPKQVAAMARKYMRDPEEIIVGQRNAGAEQVTHECYTVHARDRYGAMKRIIDTQPEFYGIVFCRTKMETQDVASRLAEDHYQSAALHGDLSQDQRDRVMKSFRSGTIRILVATDVASRGLDVTDITHVINYDLPADYDVYTHRSGRTGRAGKAGVSIVLANMREHYKIRILESKVKKSFEHKRVPTGRDVCKIQLDLILKQILSMETPDKDLAPFLAHINQTLEPLSREDLVKKLLTLDFGRILAYYKNAPELNEGRGHRSHAPDQYRDKKPEQENRPAPRFDSAESSMETVRVNLGRRDSLIPPALISLINRATYGPKLPLGRIRISDTSTVFDVAGAGAKKLVNVLNRVSYHDKKVRAELLSDAETEKPGMEKPYKKRYGPASPGKHY